MSSHSRSAVQRREKYAVDPAEKARRYWHNVAHKYGITRWEYLDILKAQGGGCAICQRPIESFTRRLCVDHKHDAKLANKFGKRATVRGLLCGMDNYWIVRKGVTPAMLRRAADYLERWPAREVLNDVKEAPTDGISITHHHPPSPPPRRDPADSGPES